MGTFGLGSTGGNYFNSLQTGDVDSGIGGTNKKHRWYYTLDYDEATNGFKNFNMDDFKLFLSALIADGQTFIIRTEQMRINNIQNKILFSFNFWKNKILPSEIISTTSNNAIPGTLEIWDQTAFNDLSTLWEDFMQNKNLYLLYRFVKSSDFIDFLNLFTYLNSQISNLGDPDNLNL